MDLGIAGKTALVCAASKGLGRGCALALAREGAGVTIVARGAEALERTADEIRRETGSTITTVAADIATPEGRAAALAACPHPDILVNNAGGPPPGDFRQWDRAIWIAAIDANMLTPIELIKATVDGMIERGFGRIVNITSSAVKAPIEVLGLSRIMRKHGHSSRARELYETALRFGLPRPVERLAQRELAHLAKRELDYTRAIALWDALRESPGTNKRSESILFAQDAQNALESAIEAAEQLAIYYEHRAKQPQRALELIRGAVSELKAAKHNGILATNRAGKIESRLARRLARLERRCAGAPPFGRAQQNKGGAKCSSATLE